MKNKNEVRRNAAQIAAKRLAEIDDLSQDIRKTLEQMRIALGESSGVKPKDLLTKLNELHAAHLKVLAAEDAFHAKLQKDADAEAIDFDAIRAEIGSQLDRLRASLLAEGFPCDPDTRSTCNAALPLRLLGDAPSDPAEG